MLNEMNAKTEYTIIFFFFCVMINFNFKLKKKIQCINIQITYFLIQKFCTTKVASEHGPEHLSKLQ
jgi:hypothetical protein